MLWLKLRKTLDLYHECTASALERVGDYLLCDGPLARQPATPGRQHCRCLVGTRLCPDCLGGAAGRGQRLFPSIAAPGTAQSLGNPARAAHRPAWPRTA